MPTQTNHNAPDPELCRGIAQLVNDAERAQHRLRTMAGMEIHWVGQDRGWPGSRKLGCRRDSDNYLEVDPDLWPLVELAFSQRAEGSALTPVARQLADSGWQVSTRQLAKMLSDPFYATGRWWVLDGARERPCRPVDWPDLVPVAQFIRAQRPRLLALDRPTAHHGSLNTAQSGRLAALGRAARVPLAGRPNARVEIERLASRLGIAPADFARIVALP